MLRTRVIVDKVGAESDEYTVLLTHPPSNGDLISLDVPENEDEEYSIEEYFTITAVMWVPYFAEVDLILHAVNYI